MNVRVVGTPSAESDVAVACFLERFLEREHPGTVWSVREALEDGRSLEATAGKLDVRPLGPDDEGAIAA